MTVQKPGSHIHLKFTLYLTRSKFIRINQKFLVYPST